MDESGEPGGRFSLIRDDIRFGKINSWRIRPEPLVEEKYLSFVKFLLGKSWRVDIKMLFSEVVIKLSMLGNMKYSTECWGICRVTMIN